MRRLFDNRWYVSASIMLMTASLALVLLTSCSSDTVAPDDQTQNQLDWLNETLRDDGPQATSGFVIDRLPVLIDTTLVAVVSPYGSQIDYVHGNEKIGFSLPYMAVKSQMTLTIRIRKLNAPFGKFWLFDCGPEGTKFKYPLYVQPNEAACNGSVLVLFYFNEETGFWEVEAKSGSFNPQVPIYHFSKYGIS